MKKMALAAAALIASLGLIAPAGADAYDGRPQPAPYGHFIPPDRMPEWAIRNRRAPIGNARVLIMITPATATTIAMHGTTTTTMIAGNGESMLTTIAASGATTTTTTDRTPQTAMGAATQRLAVPGFAKGESLKATVNM